MAQSINNVLSLLTPNDPPVYQVILGKDANNKPNKGIKFVGVVPVRDLKQPNELQYRNIINLSDSRVNPITNDTVGIKLFRFIKNNKHGIHYINMFPGLNASWSLSMYFNLDTISDNNTPQRTIMQLIGGGEDSIVYVIIYITRDGKLQIHVKNNSNSVESIQLTHNSNFIALSYDSSKQTLNTQVNDITHSYNEELSVTNGMFGRLFNTANPHPFGPGYLGAITLYTSAKTLEQLAQLTNYIAEPVDPDEPAPEEDDTTKVNSGVPNISELNNLSTVSQPKFIVNPVTGERILVKTASNIPQSTEARTYDFDIPIITPQSINPSKTIEESFANHSSNKLNKPPIISPTNHHHLQYQPY